MAARPPGDPRCKDCPEPREEDRTRCAKCARERRDVEARVREERRRKHACLVCSKPVKRDRRYCLTHLKYYAKRSALAKA